MTGILGCECADAAAGSEMQGYGSAINLRDHE
jgi:hypothetical protein